MEAVMKSFLSSEAESGQWCDVFLLCRDRKFAAHRVVLSSVSPFLREALLSGTQDTPTVIVLPDFEPKVLELLLRYIYHGEVVLNDVDLVEFICAAKVMQITIDESSMHDIKEKKSEVESLNNLKDYTREATKHDINLDYEEKQNKSDIYNRLYQRNDTYMENESLGKNNILNTKADDNIADLDILIKSDKISKHSSFSQKEFNLLEKCYNRRVSKKNILKNYVDRLRHASNKIIEPNRSLQTLLFEKSSEAKAIDFRTKTDLINESKRKSELISSRLCVSSITHDGEPSLSMSEKLNVSEVTYENFTFNNQAVNSSTYPVTEFINAKQMEDNKNEKELINNKVIRPIPSLMPIHAMLGMSHLTRYYNEMRTGHSLLDLSLVRTNTISDIHLDQTCVAECRKDLISDRCTYFGGNGITQATSIGSDAPSAFLRKSPLNDRSRIGMTSSLSRRTPCNKVMASPWTAKGPICYRREQNLDAPSISTCKEESSEEFLTLNPVEPSTRRSSMDNVSSRSAYSVSSDNVHNEELKSNDSNNNFACGPSGVGKVVNPDYNPWHDFTLKLEERLSLDDAPRAVPHSAHERTRNGNADDGHPHSIMNLISEVEDEDACATKCEICLKMFTSKCTLAAHAKTHATQARYHCDQCDKSFSQLRNYKYHVSVHKGTKEFAATCNVCGKYFNDRGYLSSHMKIHRNRKEYQCPHCPKSFNQRVAYNMHVRIHTGVKPHQCEACGKAFSRKMLLKQHYRTHSGEKPYACSVCSKRFADRSNMTLHMRLHSGVKPFSCSLCPKSFTKKHHLKTHLNYHTGNKPYACEKCGLTFSQSSNMRTHMKKCSSFSSQIVEPSFTAPGLKSPGLKSPGTPMVEIYPKKNSDIFNIEHLSRSSSIQ